MEFTDSRYGELITELFGKHPSVQNAGFTAGAYKPGIGAMCAFDDALGYPWKLYPCIHVAGTNGKGSVCSMLAAALSARGLRVGLYTSPHLRDFRERMKIVSGGRFSCISRGEVWDFLQSAPTDGLSFFEITTGMAFRWFADKKVDIAVIEVGLGGRLDSTNIITPALSIVTSIGLDHCALLGSSRAEIAAEKAGIFKKGIPALVWGHDSETDPVFEGAATRAGAVLHYAEPCTAISGMDLKGPCQGVNLGTVLSALRLLQGEVSDAQKDAICRAGAITGLHGRWETLCRQPLTIADIGHNPQALAANFSKLKGYGRPLSIVYGVMADKDLPGIAPLFPADARYYLCAPATSRAMGAEELLRRLQELRPELDLRAWNSVKEAVEAATGEAAPDTIVYIGGSTFVVSEAPFAL